MARHKPLFFVGSSKKEYLDLPAQVVREMGHALYEAQIGLKPDNAKPFRIKGAGASVLEIVENYDSDTYRAVYTVEFEEAIYVLHCFQKRSTQGIKTPQQDVEMIERRFKQAREASEAWKKQKSEKSE